MNKKIMYIGVGVGALALGYLAYRYMQTPTQTYSTTSLNPNSNPNSNYGSFLGYPFTANVDPRLDNSNQPWFNNNRAIIGTASKVDVNVDNAAMAASILKSGSDIVSSGKEIWDNVASWFDNGDADAFMQDEEYT